MTTYTAPRRDMQFVLHEFLEVERLAELPGYEEATTDVVDAIIDESAKVAETLLFPLNQPGDQQGCRFENGVVRTPDGFKDAYDQFTEAGWTSLSADPAYPSRAIVQGRRLPSAVTMDLTGHDFSSSASVATRAP
jgi:hypothetical protein